MISPFDKTFQFMIHIMIKLSFLLIIIILFLSHKLKLTIIQIPLFLPILVKKKKIHNNANCVVTLIVPIVIPFYFFHLFCLNLDLFSDFIFQIFDTLR